MSTTRDGPNPLRPYYKPPSIGIPQDIPGTTTSGTHGLGPKNGSAASYASSARDILTDIDYNEYLSDSSPSSFDYVKKQVDIWFYKYVSVLLAQPFDAAKTILQVRSQDLEDDSIPVAKEVRSGRSSYRDSAYDDYASDDSDPDEPAYFTSNAPLSHSYSPAQSRRRRGSGRGYSESPSPKAASSPVHQLILKKPDSLLEVIYQHRAKEGFSGVWKGTNVTFVYSLALQTVEKWSRGFLSSILSVPDPGLGPGFEAAGSLADAAYPWASLVVAIAAAAAAGIILAPLDLIRTKLMLTPTSTPKRSLMSQLRALPSYIIPSSLLLPTVLYNLITPTISHSTPLLLRSHLAVDPILTPNTYQLARFMSRTLELFLKLPLETVLRRGQIAVLASPTYLAEGRAKHLETTVKAGEYRGVVGTMWLIAREEGVSEDLTVAVKGKKRGQKRGQGIQGLWRGWRVGMWGLVGMWGSRVMSGGSGGTAGEF